MHAKNQPPIRIIKNDPARREPGIIVFNIRPGGKADLTGHFGWIMGVDQLGQTAFCWEFDEQPQDTNSLPSKNIIFSLTKQGMIHEASCDGQIIRSWYLPSAKNGGLESKGEKILLNMPLFHHRTNLMPNGNFLLLSAEERVLDNWPLKDDDKNSPRGSAKVIGDVIVEAAQSGQIINQWKIFDILDPYRLCYGSCSPYWRARGFPDSFDWCHANAACYDASDDSILVSLRTQDCIIKFSRKTGELIWILGDPGNWKSPWKEKLLRPVGDTSWPYHQHDCSVTPEGHVLCFDNGNFRALPFERKMPAEESYSRAVEYKIDTKNMTVKQVWSYGDKKEERLFACYQGGAYRLNKTGNTIITYGGISTIDGIPTNRNLDAFCKARIIEVTKDNEIVFDLIIEDQSTDDPVPLSSFRSDFIPHKN